MQGRHFGFLGSLCAVWIGTRIGFLSILPQAGVTFQVDELRARPPPAPQAFDAAVEGRNHSLPKVNCCQSGPPRHPRHDIAPLRHLPLPGTKLPQTEPPSFADARDLPDEQPPDWTQPSRPVEAITARHVSPFSIYAYSFIRARTDGNAPLGSGQYGGGQSGLIATYALSRFSGDTHQSKIALLLRGAIAHDNTAEREAAAGLRWHPARDVPFSVTVERRFRNARSDAFAAYLAGGVSERALPLDFRLDGFAQAGFVAQKDGGAFFDASARAKRGVSHIGAVAIRAGAGVWTGGQQGVFRIDVGPTISGDIPLADTRLSLSADWRFRIAGDARPASGPALTLSTGF
jgi:hypothetical protein